MARMAKIVRVQQDPEAESQSAFSLANPVMIETAALAGLGLLAAVFAIFLIRGFFIQDSKPRRKAAALSGQDYDGVGFGKKRSPRQ